MANVQGKFYTAETQRRGVTPSSPPNAVDDPKDPVSPSSPVSFITLTDTPSSYLGQTLKGVRVNAGETGLEFYTISSGGLPPIDGSYASQALMIADQANQTAQYIYFDGTEYWEYLGTTTPSIADYRAISAGGSSNWTIVGSDIYRNSAVAIGRTTIPTNNTFSVQSLTATGTHQFVQFLNNAGTVLASINQSGGFAVNATPLANVSGLFRSNNDADNTTSLRCTNSSNATTFQVSGIDVVSSARMGVNIASQSGISLSVKAFSTISIACFSTGNTRTVEILGSNGNYQSLGGAFFGSANASTAPTGRVNIRGAGTTTANTLLLEDSAGTDNALFIDNGQIRFLRLPTSSAGLATGSLWNNAGVINIV